MLSRSIFAVRVDLLLGVFGALLPATVGTVLGATSGYLGGWFDSLTMRVADAAQAFPFHIFLIALVFALGAGPRAFLIAITMIGWVAYARLIRAEVLRLRHADFVAAARLSGFGHRRVLFRHVLPNAIPQTIVYLAGDIVLVLITLSAVSYFGLGVQPPTPEWGQMIASGAKYLQREWWLATFPGLMIVVTGTGFTLIADGLDDRRRES
ncbi:MAG: ABC transporter permease [Ilumatobacteraceae bacterium]